MKKIFAFLLALAVMLPVLAVADSFGHLTSSAAVTAQAFRLTNDEALTQSAKTIVGPGVEIHQIWVDGSTGTVEQVLELWDTPKKITSVAGVAPNTIPAGARKVAELIYRAHATTGNTREVFDFDIDKGSGPSKGVYIAGYPVIVQTTGTEDCVVSVIYEKSGLNKVQP